MSLTRLQLLESVAERLGAEQLHYGHGTDNAFDEAVWLVTHQLGFSPAEPLPGPDDLVPQDKELAVEMVLRQRIETRKPLAYLLNSAWFCGLEFYVDERVIVPRSPIAELIENEFSPWILSPPEKILDLCTGSGCIAIACAMQFSQATVYASDLSEDALAVAEINRRKHLLARRVILLQADIFHGLPEQRYDLIVSNPPYVDAEVLAALPEEYQREPELSLAAGEDGLNIVRRILRQAERFLTDNGVLICEVGDSEVALQNAYPDVPFLWLEFEFGGHGVFLLHAHDLRKHCDRFANE